MSKDTSVSIGGVILKNPVITASGTYGFGREYSEFANLSSLGGICVKGLTLEPREGNPPPRIAETPCGILNSVGLQNPGVIKFIEDELPNLKRIDTVVFANISGDTIDEYCEMATILSDTDTDLIEMNISCPNVKQGGVAFGVNPKTVYEITSKVRRHCKKPLVVKLSPNVSDITETARAAQDGGADALSLINTLLGMKIDIKTRRPVLFNNGGGLSGPAVRPVAVRMVWQVKNTVKIPIIGMGGIMSGEDAVEFLMAGADAVAVGTACFIDPLAPIKVLDGICDYLEKSSFKSIRDITGSVICNS